MTGRAKHGEAMLVVKAARVTIADRKRIGMAETLSVTDLRPD